MSTISCERGVAGGEGKLSSSSRYPVDSPQEILRYHMRGPQNGKISINKYIYIVLDIHIQLFTAIHATKDPKQMCMSRHV